MDAAKMFGLISKIEKQGDFFKDKSGLDAFTSPKEIVGREKQTEDLLQYLMGCKKNFVVPLISVYGRSGSGKSTLVRFVCDALKDNLSYCYVNLRRGKTAFGFVNMVLGELGLPNLKSAQGINTALEKIEEAIERKLVAENRKLFVLILDEFDILFFDKRNKPSDFIYKLMILEENLRKKNFLCCIITISNSVLTGYDLDDRVKSRIGSSETSFEPYSKKDINEILRTRVQGALPDGTIDENVLDYCAEQSSLGHGDARRAIDLLRVAAEIVALEGGKNILQKHIDMASDKMQQDRIKTTLSVLSYHPKLLCFCIARLSLLKGEEFHSTAEIFHQYENLVSNKVRPLTHRRISDLLIDLENTGLVKSFTVSKGRHGYSTQFKLVDHSKDVGEATFPAVWQIVIEAKKKHDEQVQDEYGMAGNPLYNPKSRAAKFLAKMHEDDWKKFVDTGRGMEEY